MNLARVAPGGRVDWAALGACVRDGIRFLDDVLDANVWPLPQIADISRRNRKIGLGVMGWADLLIQLGIPYDSPQALALAEEVGAFVQQEGHAASRALAAERGPFPGWASSAPARRGEPPRRNATVTTIAPTGTLSVIAGCSSGIEPLFAVAYVRHALENVELREENPILAEMLRGAGAEGAEEAIRASGRTRGIEGVPREIQRLFATAHDVAPADHVRMQAAFQRHVDNGVSKTINLPREATAEEVERAYLLAHDLGCKGITVYRDGSREGQVLTSGVARNGEDCPQCGAAMSRSGGCLTCRSCGYATCETTE